MDPSNNTMKGMLKFNKVVNSLLIRYISIVKAKLETQRNKVEKTSVMFVFYFHNIILMVCVWTC